MNIQLSFDDEAKFKEQIRLAEIVSIRAHMAAMWKLGIYVEVVAASLAPKFTGHLAMSIHTLPPIYNKVYHWIEVVVVADSAYAKYVEMGFTGHFVPFSVAPELYAEAIQKWGFRPPSPDEMPSSAQPGRRYLVPPNRRSAVWGVFVSGKAQPFLTPALGFVDTPYNRDKILAQEFNRAYSYLEAVGRL